MLKPSGRHCIGKIDNEKYIYSIHVCLKKKNSTPVKCWGEKELVCLDSPRFYCWLSVIVVVVVVGLMWGMQTWWALLVLVPLVCWRQYELDKAFLLNVVFVDELRLGCLV